MPFQNLKKVGRDMDYVSPENYPMIQKLQRTQEVDQVLLLAEAQSGGIVQSGIRL